MASRLSFIILLLSLSFGGIIMFNIPECEGKDLPQKRVNDESFDNTETKLDTLPDLPFGMSEALSDASNIFGTFMGKILSKKKFLGLETFYERD